MEQFLNPDFIETTVAEITIWFQAHIFVLSAVIQFIVIALAFIIARTGAERLDRFIDKGWNAPIYDRFIKPTATILAPLSLPIIWLVLQWFSVVAAENANWDNHLIRIVVSLLTAWIIIRFGSTIIRNAALSRGIAVSAWAIAALNITGLLDPTAAVLDSMALNVGEVRISILGIIKAMIVLSFLLWLAGYSSKIFEKRLSAMHGVTPAAGVLFGKLFRVVLFTIAVVVAMDSIGVDLTAFAVFSGAIGLGIGFGLQKVFSNLISGVILLWDRSVKPGDVIAIGETYGWINALSARYVSVITRDGIEHLIPNEELISQRVENWSFSNRLVRMRIAIGVAYETDVKKAIDLVIEAALEVERVLSEPRPACHLIGFGDNSVNLELRIWINDPRNGLANVKSAILLSVWEKFGEEGIAFPFPQRDLHIKSVMPSALETMLPKN